MSPHQALSKYSIAIIWQFDGAARRVRFVLRCERHGRDVFVCRRGMGRVCRGTQSVLRKGKTEMKKNLSIFFFALLFAPLFSQAQGWGSFTGRVTDPKGGAVGGAQVTAAQEDTGFARAATTDEDGLYVIPSLRPATYGVTVEAKGFSVTRQMGVVLQADQTLTLNISIAVGPNKEH